jgi:hypothetical protein
MSTKNPSPRPGFKFLKAKPRIYIVSSFLLIALFVAGIFLYQNQNKTTNSTPPTTTLVAKVTGLDTSAPLTLVSADGQSFSFPNGQERQLPAGKYTIKTQVDELGGVNQEVEIKPNQKNEFDLKLSPELNKESGISSGDKLPKPAASSKIVQTNQDKPSPNNVIVPVNTVDQPNLVVAVSPKSETRENDSSQSSINLVQDGQSVTLADNCQILQVEFDNKDENIRYFKICLDNGQNGFYSYNLASKQEKKLLTTTETVNLARIAIDPNSDLVAFTRQNGEMGVVRDGQAEVIFDKSKFSAPRFSPDGKYLLVLDNVPRKNGGSSLYESFGLRVKAIEFGELLNKKDKAEFKDLGVTYFVPRPDDYKFQFWDFLDDQNFRVGDSPKIFNLQTGEVKYQNDDGKNGGRIYEGKDGQTFRVDQDVVYSKDNKAITYGVERVLELNDNVYYLKNGYLFRISGSELIQAYPTKILNIILKNKALYLVNQQGELLKYQF